MKNKQFTLKTLVIATLSAISLSLLACGGGGSSTPSSASPDSAYILPDGRTILSNGAVISFPTNNAWSIPGKSVYRTLAVQGGNTQERLNLKAKAYLLKDGALSEVTDFKVTIDKPVVSTGSNDAAQFKIEVPTAANGTYLVQVSADNLDNAPVVATLQLAVSPANMLKGSYLQLDSIGSLSSITSSGYNSSNMLIFSFGDPSTANINSSFVPYMQTAINNQAPGTINLLSLGGQYGHPEAFTNVAQAVSNITSQINTYNSQLSGGKISGVDLDLEGAFSPDTIKQLAQGFKANNLLVSIAPQVYTTGSPQDVIIATPSNLVLTAGYPGNSNLNTYGPAIAGGYVDYILAQTYNTGGWNVGGFAENQVSFFTAIADALNNSVSSDCSANQSASSPLCIPQNTQIVIGEVSNAGASGTVNNIFASNGTTAYDQANILAKLSDQVGPMLQRNTNVSGVFQWSLNNDYMPNGWGDAFATLGAFSSTIFGATPPPAIPYFILQVTNTGPDEANATAYGSATMVINGQYWLFGTNAPWVPAGMVPIAPTKNQQWGTLPSSQNPATPGVVDSSNLDQIFSNGNTSFTTSAIYINGYPSFDSNINQPAGQWACSLGSGYTFEAGHSYNLMVNPRYHSCDIQKIN